MFKHLFSFFLAITLVAPLLPAVAPVQAQFTAGSPKLEVMLSDAGGYKPNFPADCGALVDDTSNLSHVQWGWGDSVRNTRKKPDTNCIRVRMTNPVARYTNDFRFCLQTVGDAGPGCTPWASEGGGASQQLKSADGNINHVRIWTEERSVPAGGYFTDVAAGVQFYYKKSSSNSCRESSGVVWADGNRPASGWAWGDQADNDPGCARIHLRANIQQEYGADFAGTNIAGSELIENTSYNRDSNYNIMMTNTGYTWFSGTKTGQEGNCDGYVAAEGASPCSYTETYEAPNIKLSRLDSEPFTFTEDPIPYEQLVTVVHTSQRSLSCDTLGSLDEEEFEFQLSSEAGGGFGEGGVEQFEQEQEEKPNPPCLLSPDWVEFITRTPYLVVRASQSVPFRTAFTTPEAGNYTLRFQLTKTDGAAPGTDAQGRFGEVATIPITVVTADGGNGDPQTPAPAPRLGFSCPVAEQIVEQGGSVSYSVNVSSRNAFEGAVAIAATQLPADATSPGASTSLTAGESKSLLVAVRTAATTPVGTHTVVFTASGEGVSDETCQSRLIVQAAADENANATLEIRPASAEVEVGQQVLFSAYYDPDGNGSEPEIAVTNVAAWSINDGAIAENGDDGRFTGRYPGAGIATAAYEGLTRSANLTVAAGVQAGIAVATDGTNWQSSLSGEESLTGVDLRGAIATPLTGPTRYTFYCNRPDAGLDVTSGFDLQTTTNQDQHTATNLCDYTQPGTYTAKVIVERAGFAAEARATIVVQARNDDPTDPNDPNDPTDPTDPNDPNNGRISCTFRANPKTLFIPPAKATTLSWTCDAPAACTVTNVTDSAQVGSGNENGSATDRPNSTKVYRLNCNGTNGGTFTEDLTLRVFDVTTRVEILPK